MPKAKIDVQHMSINDAQQNISVKITFYFNILKQSMLDFFLRITPEIAVVVESRAKILLLRYIELP